MKTLIACLVVLVVASLVINALHIWRFINAGARFTADDGQQLCERVAEHERFHGLPSRPCEFEK